MAKSEGQSTVILNSNHHELVDNAYYSSIKPGDIILFADVGKHRDLHVSQFFKILAQALFKQKYLAKGPSAKPVIGHAAICVSNDKDTGPMIAEIILTGYHVIPLTTAFKTRGVEKFRPLQIFSPKDNAFANKLVEEATGSYATRHDKEAKNKATWSIARAGRALVTKAKTKGKGFYKQDEPYKQKTTCVQFTIEAMKKAARATKNKLMYPKVRSHCSPSTFLSYMLQQVEEGHFDQKTYLDIEPYAGLIQVIQQQIVRLYKKRGNASEGAERKGKMLQTALDKAIKEIDKSDITDNKERAELLLNKLKKIMGEKRTQFNPFKRATTLVASERYLRQELAYYHKLR